MALFHTTVLDNQIKALDTIGTASGSIATFDTDRAERLVSCVCEVASGSSEINITACGKNLFNSTLEQGTINASTGGINPSTTRCVNIDLVHIPQGNSRLSSNKIIYEVAYFDSAKNFVTNSYFNTNVAILNTSYSYFRVSFRNEDNSTILPTDIEIQLELGTTPTTYQAFIGTTYNIQLGETLSGDGSFDVLSGILTRSDDTTKHVEGNVINAQVGENNIYADTGDIIDLKFVLSVGKAIS